MLVAEGADRALGKLVHELAGLVDGSLRYLRLAQRGLGPTPGADDPRAPAFGHLDAAGMALTQAAELIREASSDAGRLGADELLTAFSRARSVGESIEHAMTVLAPVADEARVGIEEDVCPQAGRVAGLPMYSLVSNALRNAIEASPRGGVVRLSLRFDDAETGIELEITDEGSGPPDEVERLAMPGFTTKPAHSGLGLAICRDIVHSVGGELVLAERPNGRGSSLKVSLPLPRETV